MNLPRIAVTMGDPAGVGPEICLDLLANSGISEICTPIIFGSNEVLAACAEKTGKKLDAPTFAEADLHNATLPGIFDAADISMVDFSPGKTNAKTGRASFEFITKAIDLAMNKIFAGVATAPINKEALHSAGIRFPGHTEIFTDRTKAERSCMLQVSDEVTASFVTVHVGLFEVPSLITEERIVEVIELTREALRRIRGHEPKMVVCGLNPHAGEGGLFGNREEERIIIPAMERAAKDGASLEGPLPPDTAFLDWRRKETDAFICMYHDQGHIPLKALAFDRAVNTTLGLPIVRTSVDHGTALDIAWQAKANPRSLFEAVEMAAKLGK
ncbi:MAG: 4-hydroxythreonine-4-phosphate dehydrogenase PdxA [Verrucomicrobiales bacterium]|nr:4-hydroxythreonine-4-phosphate dehydrogenase PdxA [Verrucomicrobiales bacterium]